MCIWSLIRTEVASAMEARERRRKGVWISAIIAMILVIASGLEKQMRYGGAEVSVAMSEYNHTLSACFYTGLFNSSSPCIFGCISLCRSKWRHQSCICCFQVQKIIIPILVYHRDVDSLSDAKYTEYFHDSNVHVGQRRCSFSEYKESIRSSIWLIRFYLYFCIHVKPRREKRLFGVNYQDNSFDFLSSRGMVLVRRVARKCQCQRRDCIENLVGDDCLLGWKPGIVC
jgi:hypothetical protein